MSTFMNVPLDSDWYNHYIAPHVYKYLALKVHKTRLSPDLIAKLEHYKFVELVNNQICFEFVARKYRLDDFRAEKYITFNDLLKTCENASIYVFAEMYKSLDSIIHKLLETFEIPPPLTCGTCNSLTHVACGTNSVCG